MLGVAELGFELHLDGGGERVALQLLQHVTELDELGPRPRQRRVLAHVDGRVHFGERLDVLFGERDGFDRRAGQEVGHDLYPLGHAPQRVLQVHGHEPEQADHEQRERDGRDRERREQRGASEGEQGFANRQVHGVAAWSRGSSTAESYTSAPSWSSITRYGAWRTRSRSCVAITTAVPLALMSRSSWNTPRVARSSRLPVGSSARITRAGIDERRAPVTSRAKATFSSAVRSSSRRKSWNTIPRRRRSIGTSRGRSSATLNPETRTSPLVTGSSA